MTAFEGGGWRRVGKREGGLETGMGRALGTERGKAASLSTQLGNHTLAMVSMV